MKMTSMTTTNIFKIAHNDPEPPQNCALCPRLVKYRVENQQKYPEWFNSPAPSFGPDDVRLLIVGLAPGLQGANRTGRSFTGDHSGEFLFSTLEKFDFCRGEYAGHREDGVVMRDAMITNAVRCAPPSKQARWR